MENILDREEPSSYRQISLIYYSSVKSQVVKVQSAISSLLFSSCPLLTCTLRYLVCYEYNKGNNKKIYDIRNEITVFELRSCPMNTCDIRGHIFKTTSRQKQSDCRVNDIINKRGYQFGCSLGL